MQSATSNIYSASPSVLNNFIAQADGYLNQAASALIDNNFVSNIISKLFSSEASASSKKSILKSFLKFGVFLPTCCTTFNYFMCRFRLLPHKIFYQMWFGVVTLGTFLTVGATIYPFLLLNKIGLVSDKFLYNITSDAAQLLCKTISLLNPQLRVHHHKVTAYHADKNGKSETGTEKTVEWSDINTGTVFLTNHTSLWDGFEFMGQPYLGMYKKQKVKMMGKAHLPPIMKMLIYDCLKYFEVHFTAQDSGTKMTSYDEKNYNDFRVDREKQDAVMAKVNEWISQGNTFAYAPEGRIGRTPEEIQSPRHGMLKVLFGNCFDEKHRPDIFLLTQYPSHHFWPLKEPLGGLPADLDMSLSCFVYPANVAEEWFTVDEKTGERTVFNSGACAEAIRKFMQSELDHIKDLRANRIGGGK